MKAHRRPADDKRIIIRNGGVSVTIYPTVNRIYRKDPVTGARVLKSEHPQFTLSYYHGSRRVLRKFSSMAAARAEADLAVVKLANGESEVLKLTGTDRAEFVKARQRLRDWKADADLDHVVADYVKAASRLPAGVSLNDCVEFFLKRHPASLPAKTVRDVVDEFYKAKDNAKVSAVYLKDITGRLIPFSDAFNMRIGAVVGRDVDAYIRAMGLAPRTQNNIRRLIVTLFRFAIRRGYLPRDHGEMDAVERLQAPPSEIEIFTPDEMRKLFAMAREEMIPYLAIAAFAGLRAAEVQRLDWSEVNLAKRFIEVKAAKAKTASRRLAPIPDNLAAWLAPYAKTFGRVTEFERSDKQLFHELAPKAGIPWKHNGLRHSFISYRVAALKDVAAVALEAGNSPQMIFKHYRALVTEEQAGEWFGIRPTQRDANILPIQAADAG